jgi:hypothetical protein
VIFLLVLMRVVVSALVVERALWQVGDDGEI